MYLRNYDIDESGTFSHIEIFSMLDSLGSTLSKETISSFFTRFNKSENEELTMDEVVLCLEAEVTKPKEEKRLVHESSTSAPSTPGVASGSLSFTSPNEAAQAQATAEQTDVSSTMQPVQPGTEIVTNSEQGTVVKAPEQGAAPPSQGSLDPLTDDSDSSGEKVERGQ